jgi:hypothetical protein
MSSFQGKAEQVILHAVTFRSSEPVQHTMWIGRFNISLLSAIRSLLKKYFVTLCGAHFCGAQSAFCSVGSRALPTEREEVVET